MHLNNAAINYSDTSGDNKTVGNYYTEQTRLLIGTRRKS